MSPTKRSRYAPKRVSPTLWRGKDKKGFKRPANVVDVTRTGNGKAYSNPYKLIEHGGEYTREESLKLFEQHLIGKLEDDPNWLEPLREKDLACWCKPHLACHADILLRYANQESVP